MIYLIRFILALTVISFNVVFFSHSRGSICYTY